MISTENTSVVDQLRKVLKDGIDYLSSVLSLQQARFVDYAITTVIFVVLFGLASALVVASFVILNVALGIWLAHLLASTLWSVAILGSFYLVLAAILFAVAVSRLKRLQ